jgi:hypothetical protein
LLSKIQDGEKVLFKQIICFFCTIIFATVSYSSPGISDLALKQFGFTAAIGYTGYQNMHQPDGQTPLLRLALIKPLSITKKYNAGLELGVQTGNTMTLNLPQNTVDAIGGLNVQTVMKPLVDVLVYISAPINNSTFDLIIKGGTAYRSWQLLDRCSGLSRFDGEVQAGVGYRANQTIQVSVLYQGIYGASPHFVANIAQDTCSVSNIPIQQGVLLNFTYSV